MAVGGKRAGRPSARLRGVRPRTISQQGERDPSPAHSRQRPITRTTGADLPCPSVRDGNSAFIGWGDGLHAMKLCICVCVRG